MASLCSTVSRASAERIPRMDHSGSRLRPGTLKYCSCTCLAGGAGCWLWTRGWSTLPMASSWTLDSRTAWQPQDFFLDGLRLQSGSHLAFYDLALKVTPCHKPAQIQRERDKFHLSVLLQKSMWDRRYCYCCVWIGLPKWC